MWSLRYAGSAKALYLLRGLRGGFGPVQQQGSLAGVLGQGGCAFELGASLGEAAEFEEEVAADAGQKVVILESGFRWLERR